MAIIFSLFYKFSPWLVSLIIFLLSPPPTKAEDILIKPGETHRISAKGKIWIENSKILKVTDEGKKFAIKGLRQGHSLIKINDDPINIFVLSPAQEKAWLYLLPTIQKTLGLSLKMDEGKIIVTGKLVRWADWKKIYLSCRKSECDFELRAQIDDSALKDSQKKISEIFQQNGLPPQNILWDGRLQALVSSKGETAQRVTEILKALGISPVLTAANLDLTPQIKVQITVAEVRRNESLNYGIKLPDSYSAQLLPAFLPNTTSQMMDVHFLEQNGLAKILASPTIVCKSGESGSFFAGGEFPIKILNYKVQDVIWKKYGIILNVKPLADFSGKMSVFIETEISSIDKSRSVDGLPALFSNKIQSHFELNESRTIALSGLIKSEQAENGSGLPGLANIPIFGTLFSSKDFINNRTELVVFVKPEVVSPGSLEANL